MSYPTITHQF